MALLSFFMLGSLSLGLSAAAEDVQIQVGSSSRNLKARIHQGAPLYSVSQLADHLGFEIQERGGLLRISGPRGSLHLTDGRPLVRFQDQFLMLSQPAWQRSRGDWYVAEDFLTRAVFLILDSKLEKTSARRYRIEVLDENKVEVQVVNYPDHVSIVFVPDRPSPINVRELGRILEVEFGQFRVTPNVANRPPNQTLVQAVSFDRGHAFGRFEIIKGPRYARYRVYDLSDPPRKVVDIYPAAAAEVEEAPDPAVVFDPVAPKDQPLFDIEEDIREYSAPHYDRALVIDPGHGGDNYGVRPTPEISEKDFLLDIAQQLENRLKPTRHKVLLTRSRDINLSLERRSSIANVNRSKAFVSLHVGASTQSEMSGPVVYIHRYAGDPPSFAGGLRPWAEGQRAHLEKSRQLADKIQLALNELYGSSNKVAEAPLGVLAPVMSPAVVIELGFLTNRQDRARLEDARFQEQVAQVISKVLLELP